MAKNPLDFPVEKSRLEANIMNRFVRYILPLLVVFAGALQFSSSAHAQSTTQADQAILHGYQKAPQPIHDILDGSPTPLVLVSPKSDQLLVVDRLAYPPVADLAQPMLRLAGLRINPATNGRHHPPRLTGMSLVDVATGKTSKVRGLPAKPYLSVPEWSPTGERFAFTNTTADGIELWFGLAGSAEVRQITGVKVSAILGDAFQWMPHSNALLVEAVPSTRS